MSESSSLTKRNRSSFESDDESDNNESGYSSDSEPEVEDHDESKRLEEEFSSLVVVSQSELDTMEQRLSSNPMAYYREWLDLIKQYRFRYYASSKNISNKNTTDLPKSYSSLTNEKTYMNVSAFEKLRQIRWSMSDQVPLGEKRWNEWLKEEEEYLEDMCFSTNSKMLIGTDNSSNSNIDNTRNTILLIYERCLLWENPSYKNIADQYCNFILKYYEEDSKNEQFIEDSFNFIFELIGFKPSICDLFLEYLQRKEEENVSEKKMWNQKIRNLYRMQLEIPSQNVFNVWNSYVSWEKNSSDEVTAENNIQEMNVLKVRCMKELELRLSLETDLSQSDETNKQTNYLNYVEFEETKYQECKNYLQTFYTEQAPTLDMSFEDLSALLRVQKSRVVELLKKGSFDCWKSEQMWQKYFSFLVAERSYAQIFTYIPFETYVSKFEEIVPADQLNTIVQACVTSFVATKNNPWSSTLWNNVLIGLSYLYETLNLNSTSITHFTSKFSELIQNIMYHRVLGGLNCYANDLGYKDFYQVFSCYCTVMARLNRFLFSQSVNYTNSGITIQDLPICQQEVFTAAEQGFENLIGYMKQYFEKDDSKTYLLELQYTEFMLENEQVLRAKELFELHILQASDYKKDIKVWYEYIQLLERLNWFSIAAENALHAKTSSIRDAYLEGVKNIESISNRKTFIKSWILFEKCNCDSLDTVIMAEKAFEKITVEEAQTKKEKKEGKRKEKIELNKKEKTQQTTTAEATKDQHPEKPKKPRKEKENAEPKSKKVKIEENIDDTTTGSATLPEKTEEGNNESKTHKSHNVVLWNLPYKMKEDELRMIFQNESFEPKRVTLVKKQNGSSKGMAFVELTDDLSLQNAIQKFNGFKIDEEGHAIHASEADPNKMKRILHNQKQLEKHKGDRAPPKFKPSAERQTSFVASAQPQPTASNVPTKKPAFKPRNVKPVSHSSKSTGSTRPTSNSSPAGASNITPNSAGQSVGGLSNDDFKRFLRPNDNTPQKQ
ncbi:hypothetical protein C9374_007068 [Naegleria lovaniensis]|uniref:RRM domain-containing protein n=1 Tax=Naegleria lovaniensis TaxID=51637 RepID=A0AA88H6M7_NAELO|nr:uncharacterized protein C9374_007068 [Naegleria lovaniensis]KAG2393537.1 hypothetical protein C9374_007068 [Naegleria lovaniensis]